MKTVAISVYDEKALFYSAPTCVKTEGEALRMFSVAANDPQGNIGQFPSDYSLYVVGSFDDSSGEFSPCIPKFLSRGSEHVKLVSVRSED